MDERVHLLGIRHHGPGSATSLVAALDALTPDTVLIEGPPEGDALIPYAAAPGMRPPIAMLAYAADEPARAFFLPFAVYSPEWQAMRWALRHGRPARFIDWPAGMSLAHRTHVGSDGEEPDRTRGDPLDRLAALSGHADGEALWNALVESRGAAQDVFAAIERAMTELRLGGPEPEAVPETGSDLREARREAHMRLEVRKALKEHAGPIAVVVGAWHVPALRLRVPASQDRATLKDARRIKASLAWVPWTEPRLAAASGYGAGIASPGWYGHLWSLYEAEQGRLFPDRFAAGWQARVAGLLRGEGLSAAPASVIEATRLSLALSALRGHALPGLEEMRDATLAALCHGDQAPYRLVETRLVVGTAIGALDETVPQTPLAADLARWQRKLRLAPSATPQEFAFDLRSEAGFAKSVLLHRLTLMEVRWGELVEAEAGRGTFREIWRLAWVPELSVRLAEALVHGITIEQAAAGAAVAQATAGGTASSAPVPLLARLVRGCLLADLPAAAELCIARLQAAAIDTADVLALMRAVPEIVSILRYGTARSLAAEPLATLARSMIVEVTAGILIAVRGLDEEAAEQMRTAMAAFDAALVLMADAQLLEQWNGRLCAMAGGDHAAPLAAGLALRRLHDRAVIAPESVATSLSRALSPAIPPQQAGYWLEGFLDGNGDILLHDRELLDVVDAWMCARQEEEFLEILPMLRRAFAGFAMPSRRRLLAEVTTAPGGLRPSSEGGSAMSGPGFAAAKPLLLTILDLAPATENRP